MLANKTRFKSMRADLEDFEPGPSPELDDRIKQIESERGMNTLNST
jgi:hypothetical protein